jgi:hypothetical protein
MLRCGTSVMKKQNELNLVQFFHKMKKKRSEIMVQISAIICIHIQKYRLFIFINHQLES